MYKLQHISYPECFIESKTWSCTNGIVRHLTDRTHTETTRKSSVNWRKSITGFVPVALHACLKSHCASFRSDNRRLKVSMVMVSAQAG